MDIIIMSNISFPDASWTQNYTTGGDFLNDGDNISSSNNLWRNAQNYVINVKVDLRDYTDRFDDSGYRLFQTTSMANYIYLPSDFAPKSCKQLFMDASYINVPPLFDTSRVTTMQQMFNGTTRLMEIPQYDTSKVTTFDTFIGGGQLRSLPAIDASSATTFSYAFGYEEKYHLRHFGGFINLGKQSTLNGTSSGFLNYLPNLTKESIMNIINNLYDRAAAGFSVKTIKMHANHLAVLTDEEKAIATNKGWTLS